MLCMIVVPGLLSAWLFQLGLELFKGTDEPLGAKKPMVAECRFVLRSGLTFVHAARSAVHHFTEY